MIYPDVTAEEWTEKYKLKVRSMECPQCKKEYPLNVPFIMKGGVGFEMEYHGCGIKGHSQVIVYTPADPKEIEFWRSVVGVKDFL